MKYHRLIVYFLITLILLAPFSGYAALPDQSSPSSIPRPESSPVRSLTVEQAMAGIKAGKFGIIIDLREPHEYKTGRIPKAINIPQGMLPQKIKSQFPSKNTAILVYCRSGRRSRSAAEVLKQLGYTSVFDLPGGIIEWEKAGYPLNRSGP